MSRRSIQAWFQPIYALLHQAAAGELECIRDNDLMHSDRAIIFIPTSGKYSWADMALEGTYCTLRDLFPDDNYDAADSLVAALRTPVEEDATLELSKPTLDDIRNQLRDFESRLIRIPAATIGAAVRRQYDLIEMRSLIHGNSLGDAIFQKGVPSDMQTMRQEVEQSAQH